MVSALTSTRLWSMQATLRIMKAEDEAAKSGKSGAGSAAGLLEHMGRKSDSDHKEDDSHSTYDVSKLRKNHRAEAGKDSTKKDGVPEFGSEAFMKALKEKLEALKESPATRGQAEAMLAALKEGKLNVTDSAGGQKVQAWDPAAKDAEAKKATATDKQEWSAFLRSHLTREASGKFALNKDGSYTDAPSGNNAFFGMVGDKYLYLNWPKATG
ncbi:hypothetical protein [Rhizobium sp. SSA_523]|uniref:hypothetical protein n=1 Tax=Rhizobium sp. SSA_523 TaxID=2952477 RepID=UPI002091D8B0|nr:hypothetical protein [Rhizobium sp. SSA_523]MCO5731990.1 hypothetical protein [Rhizobium sp. SSA_523]WKC22668.1 hypothetical protein QTJ18_17575 [Rhizobium sp. SSA_523]